MGWVRTDFTFQLRSARVVVTAEQMHETGLLRELMALRDEPEALANGVRLVVAKLYPEIAEGEIWSIVFNHAYRQWEVVMTHPTFAPTPPSQELPLYPPADRPTIAGKS